MILALFPELLASGGVQTAGRLTAASLADIARQKGWPFRFLSLNDAGGEHELISSNQSFTFNGYARNKMHFTFDALRIARSRPTIIFAAHPHLAPVAVLARANSRRSRVIVSAHGVEVWQRLPTIRRKALSYADAALAPSAFTADKLVAIQSLRREIVHQLPWPLDPEYLALSNSPESLPLPSFFPRGRVVLTVGRWVSSERYKGADLLIQSIAELSGEFGDAHLVLVGSGDDLPWIKQIAAKTPVPERFHFLNHLARPELAACYAHAEIFALPSAGEGFGFVFLEAMVFRKPVIGMRAGGIPDIVEDGVAGFLVDPKDSHSLTNALRTLFSDCSLSRRMGESAGEAVRRRFSFARFQEELGKIISTVSAR